VPQIEVTFDIDANGIVSVSAKDKATNKEQSIRIQPSGGLTDTDIERMVKDAAEHAAEDKARRQLAESKNAAEALLHSTDGQLKEYGDKLGAGDKKAIEDAMASLRTALEGENASDIAAKTQVLVQAAMKIGEVMYGQGGDADGSAGGGQAGGGGSGVVDADFEEVDDDRKKSA
jgi:molecular chaperone DnaK